MSLVTNYTKTEFNAEFPIDLGSDIRAALISRGGFEGLIIGHLVSGEICSVVVSFQLTANNSALWGLLKKDPATLTVSGPPIECINCPQAHMGRIENGKWIAIQH